MKSTDLFATGTLVVIGFAGGVFFEKYHNLKNTPEATITKLENAKEESKKAKKEYDAAYKANQEVLTKIQNTKDQYKAEVRADVEAKVRKELENYISKADETYEKAKKENELASVKLELSKRQVGVVLPTRNFLD